MSLWRQFVQGIATLTSRKALEQDVADEVQQYVDEATAALLESGVSLEEARRTARLEVGNPMAISEQIRESRWENAVSTGIADVRYAARQLRQNPGFALVSILTLSLGIGASAGIFSAVDRILFEPLPYPHSDRIMMISERDSDGYPLNVSFGTFHGLSDQDRSFQSTAVSKVWEPAITAGGPPEKLEGQRVSADYFRVLGILPSFGRDFTSFDDQLHGPNVVILSDRLWKRRFGAMRSLVGRQIRLEDTFYTVVGVMPSSFENVLLPAAELWSPLQYDPSLPPDGKEWGHHLQMIGRLRDGISKQQAVAQLDAELRPLIVKYAKGYDNSGGPPRGMIVNSVQSDLTRSVRPALLAILGAVILVLLVACVNVTNLLLARGAQRRGEFALRVALGAGRVRITRQIVTEGLLIALLGAALGIIVAFVGVRVLISLSPPELPRIGGMGMNPAVLVFAVGVTTLTGLLIGLFPALHAPKNNLHVELQQGSRRTAGGHLWTRRTLVMAEVALALVLLITSGLLLRSMQRLFASDPGFDTSHLLTMQVQESGHRLDNPVMRHRYFDEVLEAVRQVPGVFSAGLTSQLPLSGEFEVYGVQFERENKPVSDAACRYAISPGYVQTMHIPLRRGRLPDDRDRNDAPRVVLINESFAKRKFPGQDPIGQRVRMGPDAGHPDRPWSTIVGIVGDVKQESLAVGEDDAFYVPTTQWAWADKALWLVLRVHGDPAAFAPRIRKAIWSVDQNQPISRVGAMKDLVLSAEAKRRFALILFEAFAAVALVLAAIGIYGVLSGSVTERMREIGVRAALGASRRDILALIVGQGLKITILGVVIGLVTAVAATEAIVSMLFGVSRLDPITYSGVIVLLIIVSGLACWIPAWRAAHVDPSISLRAD